jgi:hypothetical protein
MLLIEKEIKKIADLEACLGKKLARNLLKLGGGHHQKKPRRVCFYSAKPSFCLNDGSTLHAYAADLKTGELTNERYCGSNDSAMFHKEEQFGEGHEAPENKALIFKEAYWNGTNMSWTLYVISPNITRALEANELKKVGA